MLRRPLEAKLGAAIARLEQAERIAVAAGVGANDPLRMNIAIKQADAQIDAGQPEHAEAILRATLPRMPRDDLQQRHLRAWALNILGAALSNQNRHTEAITALEDALALQQDNTITPSLHCDILNDLGIALFHAGHRQTGTTRLDQALECSRRFYGEDHPMTQAVLGNLAWIQAGNGEPAAAAETYARLLPSIRRTAGPGPNSDVAYTLGMMALALNDAGDDAALETMRDTWQEWSQLDDRMKNRWIGPAYALLRFERNLSDGDELLDTYSSGCDTLGGRSRLTQRICVAQRVLASDHAECLSAPEDDPVSVLAEPAQRVWLAGYWLAQGAARMTPLDAGWPNRRCVGPSPAWRRCHRGWHSGCRPTGWSPTVCVDQGLALPDLRPKRR